eukprot:c14998_g1_i1.p1 GENE.c14998_g1_i1~~c14998_g1_i1.p1  ORF type:complete len:300 (-),score=77.31 c14998_g1_i1:260-1159(-)
MGGEKGVKKERRMSSSLFCGNLAFTSTDNDLKAHCDSIGIKGIAQVELSERNGRSRGWALLHFANEADAQVAQQKLNNTVLAGRTLNVRENRDAGAAGGERTTYTRPAHRAPAAAPQAVAPQVSHQAAAPVYQEGPEIPCNRVFVGNLPWSITATELSDLFAHYNPESTEIQKRLSGRSKGFGTIVFRTESDATAAKNALNNTQVDGRTISVRYDKEGSVEPTARIFVGNLPWSATDDDLKEMFEGFAVVSASVKVVNGRSRGFGIVEFQTLEEAKRATNTKSEFTFQDRSIFTKFDRQ